MTPDNSARRPGARFPDLPIYSGFDAPGRVEADVFELEVDGAIPYDLDGSFYRVAPEPQFPPKLGDDIVINGDGMVSMFRFHNGHVDFKSRYVRTDKFALERAARRSLFGAYRNPYTDDPSVRGRGRGTANTNIIRHAGKLLALKEDSLPVELHPDALETIGTWDYGGRVTSRTFSAHPKIDPVTGEMLVFGYAAKGETTRDIAFYVIDGKGNVTDEQWFEAPYAAELHDFVVTRDHVIFPVMPTTTDLDRIKAGGPHWLWDPSRTTRIGIFPRRGGINGGGVKEMRWFEGPARWCFHFYNAYSDGSKVVVDGLISDAQTFPFMYPDTAGRPYDPSKAVPTTRRWTFDLASRGSGFDEQMLFDQYAEFGRVDERYAFDKLRYGFAIANEPSLDFAGGGLFGPAFNAIMRYDFQTSERSAWHLDSKSTAQEPVFVPRGEAEGDGYLVLLVNRFETMLNDLLILDAQDLEAGPIATVKLPLRLRNGVHGNWVPSHLL